MKISSHIPCNNYRGNITQETLSKIYDIMNQDYAICKIKGPIKLTYITKITSKKKKNDYQLERNSFKELDLNP